MKTNFLYFRENGYQQYTATAAQAAFTINGDANWDLDVTDDTEVKVSVTALADGTDNVGTAYLANGDAVAGTTYVLDATDGYSYSGDTITIATTTGSATKGYDIEAGDIVTIELIPVEGTEACFRADKLLAVNSASDTSTVLKFKASNGAAADDTVTLTHPDNDGAEFKLIADYIHEVCNANIAERGNVITCWDKQNNVIGRGLAKAGVTKMLLAIA